MSLCPVQNQKQVLKKIARLKTKASIEDIGNIIKEELPNYTIEKALSNFDADSKEKLVRVLLKAGYTSNPQTMEEQVNLATVKKINDINSDFLSTEVTDLFSGVPGAEKYFKREVNSLLGSAIFFGTPESANHVRSNADLNKSIKYLKNTLFQKIVDYLVDNSKLNKDDYYTVGTVGGEQKFIFTGGLYKPNGKFKNYDLYKASIETLNEHFREKFGTSINYNDRRIINIPNNLQSFKSILDIYNAAVILVNFDNVISKYFDKIVGIDLSVFNSLEDSATNPNKYSQKIEGIVTEYWKKETHEADSVDAITDNLTKTIIGLIPHYNADGSKLQDTLEPRDFYGFGAMIKDFELENINYLVTLENWVPYSFNPIKGMQYYINTVLDAYSNGFKSQEFSIFNKFSRRVNIARSLDEFYKSIKKKEDNSEQAVASILSHVLNNSYGAKYSIVKIGKNSTTELLDLNNHNADRVAAQNSLFTHLLSKASLPKTFIIGLNKISNTDDLKKERLYISQKIKTDSGLINFINDILGIKLPLKSAQTLRELWKDKTSISLQKILESIRNPFKQGKNLLELVSEAVSDLNDDSESASKSSIIQPLTKTSELQDILDVYLATQIIRPITTTKTLEGNNVPTFKIASLAYMDVELLYRQAKKEQTKKYQYKNILLAKNAILGTISKLEVQNSKLSSSAFTWTALENFTSNFVYDFLHSFKPDSDSNYVSFMIGNYSDKNHIVAKMIDKNLSINGKFLIGNQLDPESVLPTDDLIKVFQNQYFSFYNDMLIENIFPTYEVLGVVIDYDNVPKSIKNINTFLKQFTSKESFLEVIRYVDTLPLVEELHYSSYFTESGERLALNQSIIDLYNVFKDDVLFNDFVKYQRSSFANALKEITGANELFTSSDLNGLGNAKDFESILTSLGIPTTKYTTFKDNHMIESSSGILNPLVDRWLWVSNLLRSEYEFMSFKGTYMHPHKLKGKLLYRGDSETNLTELYKELSGRLPMMSKRNVVWTASIEIPLKNIRLGEPSQINIAVISDSSKKIHNTDGTVTSQDIHDGASYIPYIYSKMIEASYPGKSYLNTKKRFGTFSTDFGGAIKKDAEFIVNNQTIRSSLKSPISLLNKQKQFLGIPLTNITFNHKGTSELYSYINGVLFKIIAFELKTIDNKHQLILKFAKKENDLWRYSHDSNFIDVNNLYDIWNAVGAQYSADKFGNFNEGSNDFIYNLITTLKFNSNGIQTKDSGDYLLKDAMIHVISNYSVFKAGASNINPEKAWYDGNILKYTKYNNDFLGPQLDASHEADDSEIREVTQVMAALSQNPRTTKRAYDVYKSISKIIERSLIPYKEMLTYDINTTSRYFSKKVFKALKNSSIQGLGKVIAETFSSDQTIPFSHPHFFQTFVRDMVSNMNEQFISRPYKGMAATLMPSEDIILVYEDINGNIYTQEDVAKLAFEEYIPGELIKDNETIISDYINSNFSNVEHEIELSNVLPNDNIIIEEEVEDIKTYPNGVLSEITLKKVPKSLKTIQEYYAFKNNYKGRIWKDYSAPRNLKPTIITYSGTNLYDSDPVKLLYALEYGSTSIKDNLMLNSLKTYLSKLSKLLGEPEEGFVFKFLKAWNKRNQQLLDKNVIIPNIDIFTDDAWERLFKRNAILIFGEFDDVFSDINRAIELGIVMPVTNYKFTPAELVMPNIYKTSFNVEGTSVSEIIKNKEKFFSKFLEQEFEEVGDDADFRIRVKNGNNPIVVKYVNDIEKVIIENATNSYGRIQIIERSVGNTVIKEKFRIDPKGNVLYKIPTGVTVSIQDGVDYVYIALSEISGESNILLKSFERTAKDFIKSFGENISSITPLKHSPIKVTDKSGIPFNQNEVTYQLFREIHNYNGPRPDISNDNWFIENKSNIINQISKQMFVSWQKSLEFIAARIPSQSMQSFMPMKNIAYIPGEHNSAYVSIWQIWLQGSDFDIDKVFLMGHSFNRSGQYESWSPITNYSTLEQLNIIEKLPLPSGIFSKIGNSNNIDLSQEFNLFDQNYVEGEELNAESLLAIYNALNKLGDSSSFYLDSLNNDKKIQFLNIINRHNLSDEYLEKPNSVKNAIVAGIKEIISTPSSQIWANSPVSTRMHHIGADAANEKYGFKELPLSPYDNISYYKMQERAAVGKQDVGIGANGLKVFFTLSNYYNNWIYSGEYKTDNLLTSNKSFKKTLTVNGKTRTITTLADISVPKDFLEKIMKSFGLKELKITQSDAALTISGFVSGATDNAKELIMAKINAILDLASVHLYMYSLGYSASEVALYMNSPFVKELGRSLSVNNFKIGSKKQSIFSLLVGWNKKTKTNPAELPSGHLVTNEDVVTFLDLFKGSQEFKNAAAILKVNQKTKANTVELEKFFSKLESAMFSGELMLEWDLFNTRNFANNLFEIPKYDNLASSDKKIVDAIYNTNGNFRGLPENDIKEYIIKVLFDSGRVIVRDLDNPSLNKQVSLLGGQFDFRYFMQESNSTFTNEYKDRAIDYYNLFKNTINIFDVIDKSPHFRSMIEGVRVTHSILGKISKKYNVMFSVLKDVIRENSKNLQKRNSHLKQLMGNVALPLKVEDYMLSRISTTVDKIIIKNWLNTSTETFKFTFNVNELLKMAGIESIVFYKNDKARIYSEHIRTKSPEKLTSEELGSIVKISIFDNVPTILRLSTDIDIANFKVLMESVILPILNKSEKSNLGNHIKLGTVKNFFGKFTTQIIPTENLSNLNNDYNFEKFQEILLAFNKIDVSIENELKIKNSEGVVLPMRDLFYLYNLFVNNEMYGNKRLTPMFEDYVKYQNSLSRDLINYYRKTDLNEINLFSNMNINQINALIFGTFHRGGGMNLLGNVGQIYLKNGDFVINSDVDFINNKDLNSYRAMSTIVSTIKNKNLIINYKCD